MESMKIALVGSAPSSASAAPYGNPEWRIYGCSPGLYGVASRVDEWFELHLYEPGAPWFSPEYCQWLANLPKRGVKLWTGRPDPDGPSEMPPPIEGAEVLPYRAMTAKYDPQRWFCSSSLFWMMCRAMDQIEEHCEALGRPPHPSTEKIGFWGVDMAATEEYQMQRAGIHFLTYIARNAGIEVGAPLESDLFTPRFRYGIDEWSHSFRKTRARRAELEARLRLATQEQQAKLQEMQFLTGALDDLTYMAETWVTRETHAGPPAVVRST